MCCNQHTKKHKNRNLYHKDSHDCFKIIKSLKISDDLSILWHGKVSSGCKMLCGAITAQKLTDVYLVVIHDSNFN